MNKKLTSVVTSITIPLVFISGLYILNPVISFFKLNTQEGKLALAVVGIALALSISYIFNKDMKQDFIPNKATLKKTLIGFFIGVFITLIMIGILLIFSDLKVELNPKSNYLKALTWCLIFFPLAYMEELIFRGVAFVKLKDTIGIRSAQLLFAFLFALYHDPAGNTFGMQLLGPGIWALIYGWAAIKSGGIAFPTGIHAGINIIQAAFGMKEDVYSIWEFYYNDAITPKLNSKTEMIGVIMQLIVLIIGIILTEKLSRKKAGILNKC